MSTPAAPGAAVSGEKAVSAETPALTALAEARGLVVRVRSLPR